MISYSVRSSSVDSLSWIAVPKEATYYETVIEKFSKIEIMPNLKKKKNISVYTLYFSQRERKESHDVCNRI